MKKRIILTLLALAALIGLFIILKPSNSVSRQPKLKTFNYVIKNGRITAGADVISLKQNDQVKIKVTSDAVDELHLHGYNKEVTLEANKPNSIEFNASLTGRFAALTKNEDFSCPRLWPKLHFANSAVAFYVRSRCRSYFIFCDFCFSV
jgi:hypothetical protein